MTSQISHLSHEQLCDIVLARSPHPLSSDFAALQEHLSLCPACATELSNLRTSLSIFRDASTSFAQQELLRLRTENRVESTSVHSLPSTALQPASAGLAVAAVCASLCRARAHHRVRRGASQRHQPDALCLHSLPNATLGRSHRQCCRNLIHFSPKEELT